MSNAWSYSSLTKYDTCPRQYYEVRVAKNFVDEENEQSRWGTETHTAIENHFTYSTPIPDRMKAFEAQVLKVRDHVFGTPGEFAVEIELGIDKTLTEGRAFDAEDCYARCIVDLLKINANKALNIDWKTGRKKDSNQLRMSSGIIFANFPEVETVYAGYVWLATGDITKQVWKRTDDIWKVFYPLLERLEWSKANNAWPPKPSGLCRGWCPVKTCEYWQPKRIKR